jgi:hypothetical protein
MSLETAMNAKAQRRNDAGKNLCGFAPLRLCVESQPPDFG